MRSFMLDDDPSTTIHNRDRSRMESAYGDGLRLLFSSLWFVRLDGKTICGVDTLHLVHVSRIGNSCGTSAVLK